YPIEILENGHRRPRQPGRRSRRRRRAPPSGGGDRVPDDAVEEVSERVSGDGGRLGGARDVGSAGLQRMGPRAWGPPRELPPLPGGRGGAVARNSLVPAVPAVGADLGTDDGAVAGPGP